MLATKEHEPFGIRHIDRVAMYANLILALFFFVSLFRVLINYVSFVRFEGSTDIEPNLITGYLNLGLAGLVLACLVVVYDLLVFRSHGFGFTMFSVLACGVVGFFCLAGGVLGTYEIWEMTRETFLFDRFFGQKFLVTAVNALHAELHCCSNDALAVNTTLLKTPCCDHDMDHEKEPTDESCNFSETWREKCKVQLKKRLFNVKAWLNCTLIGVAVGLLIMGLVNYLLGMAIKHYYYY